MRYDPEPTRFYHYWLRTLCTHQASGGEGGGGGEWQIDYEVDDEENEAEESEGESLESVDDDTIEEDEASVGPGRRFVDCGLLPKTKSGLWIVAQK